MGTPFSQPRTARGRSVITAFTPSDRHRASCSSVLTVQTWRSRPVRHLLGELRVLRQLVDARAEDPVVLDHRLEHRPVPGLLDQHHQRQARREPLHPLQRDVGEAHHPDRAALTGPAEVGERLDEAPLDQPAVTRRVLGLDRELDRPVRVRDGLEQPAQREHLVEVGIRIDGLVVESRPRVLPRGELELVEIGQLHRRDQAARARDPPEITVVDADQVTVRGQPDVALQRLGPLADRFEIGPPGVLGVLVARAAVRDDLGPHAHNSDPSRRATEDVRRVAP